MPMQALCCHTLRRQRLEERMPSLCVATAAAPSGWLMGWGAGTWRGWTPHATHGVFHAYRARSSLLQFLRSVHDGLPRSVCKLTRGFCQMAMLVLLCAQPQWLRGAVFCNLHVASEAGSTTELAVEPACTTTFQKTSNAWFAY